MTELKILENKPLSLSLYSDNKDAINFVHTRLQHDRTKHVEIDRHVIKEILFDGQLCIPLSNQNTN